MGRGAGAAARGVRSDCLNVFKMLWEVGAVVTAGVGRAVWVAGKVTTLQIAVVGVAFVLGSVVVSGPPVSPGEWGYSLVWLPVLAVVFGVVHTVLLAGPAAVAGWALARRLPGPGVVWHLSAALALGASALALYPGQWWLPALGFFPALTAARA